MAAGKNSLTCCLSVLPLQRGRADLKVPERPLEVQLESKCALPGTVRLATLVASASAASSVANVAISFPLRNSLCRDRSDSIRKVSSSAY